MRGVAPRRRRLKIIKAGEKIKVGEGCGSPTIWIDHRPTGAGLARLPPPLDPDCVLVSPDLDGQREPAVPDSPWLSTGDPAALVAGRSLAYPGPCYSDPVARLSGCAPARDPHR